MINRSVDPEIPLQQTVLIGHAAAIGNIDSVDVSDPRVVFDRRCRNVGIRFCGTEMERRRGIGDFAFVESHPFFDYGYMTFFRHVGEREIIDVVAGIGAAGEVFVNELLLCFAVDGNIAVFIDYYRVRLFVEFEPCGSHGLFKDVSTGNEVIEQDDTVGAGSPLGVIILAGQPERGAGHYGVVGFVVLPELEFVIRFVDDGKIAGFGVERIDGIAVFVDVAYGNYTVGVTYDREHGIKREITFIGRSFDHRILALFEVPYMDHAVAAGRYGHIDLL